MIYSINIEFTKKNLNKFNNIWNLLNVIVITQYYKMYALLDKQI